MTQDEFEKASRSLGLLTAQDLTNTTNRTLLYGYTCARDTWHVYLFDGEIKTVIYNRCLPTLVDVRDNHGFVPDKRLYPERCDFEFSMLLRARGVSLPFTNFDERRVGSFHENGFYGETFAGDVLPAKGRKCSR